MTVSTRVIMDVSNYSDYNLESICVSECTITLYNKCQVILTGSAISVIITYDNNNSVMHLFGIYY